jgi:hypothetical protein
MLLWTLFVGCGDKCPAGYEVNEEERACYPVEQDTTDTNDTASTTDTSPTIEDDTDEDTAIEVDPFAELSKLNGKIIIPSLFEGRLIPRSAFWYQVDDKFLVYMSANSSATCDLAGNRLNANATQENPTDLFIQDHCNVGIFLEDVNNISEASFFSECTFGVGSFGNGTGNWRWSGTDENGVEAEFFIGAGLEGSVLDFQQDGTRRAVSIEVTEWAGNFPYSSTYNTSGAVGTGNGYIVAEECAALENTTYLTENAGN